MTDRYRPPGDTLPDKDSDKLQATNYENTTLFLVSCFQYILVAGVFSIGPPYRKSMWSNGFFMLALSVIGLLNVWMMLFPPKPLAILLELMAIPFVARATLAFVVVINIVFSTVYERWGSAIVADVVGLISEVVRANVRSRGGNAYKPVDAGPR